jgi:hypothetical protein
MATKKTEKTEKTEKARFKWACPKCGAGAGAHGTKPGELCDGDENGPACQGLICECEEDCAEDHGETFDDPCKSASCYHCGWGGTVPKKPKGLQAWEKTALAAGWSPPAARAKEIGGGRC